MATNTACTWEQLAEERDQRNRRTPGISLLSRRELDILAEKDLDGRETAAVLSVKAVFEGTIVE